MSNRLLIVCGGSGIGLLGQQRILGVASELQIDASSEVRPGGTRHRSYVLKLDEHVPTTAVLLGDAWKRAQTSTDRVQSDYVRQSYAHPAAKRHLEYLNEAYSIVGDLQHGLAQAPAIGGAAIRDPNNVSVLRTLLEKMFSELPEPGGQTNPVHAWIISSTAGGTGEGVHRFVAATLASVCATHQAPVTLNFVRVGALTYRTVNAKKTALNSFFAVAADAAFALKCKDDFPRATVNWFYIDLPDVGTGSEAKRTRADMIEMATKAVMLEELANNLNTLLVNHSGARMIVTKTGFWGRDFDKNLKYYETLKQLVQKLTDLIQPDYTSRYIRGQAQPQFEPAPWEATVKQNLADPQLLRRKIQAGWKLPAYRERDLSNRARLLGLLAQWRSSILDLASIDIENVEVPITIEQEVIEGGHPQKRTVPLTLTSGSGPDQEWFAAIDNTHRVKAWCSVLLGTGSVTTDAQGLLKTLHTLAAECTKVQYPSIWGALSTNSEKQAKALVDKLWPFVQTAARVRTLLSLEQSASRQLVTRLVRALEVQKVATSELDTARNAMQGVHSSPVNAAALSAPLDRLEGRSWFDLLERAVRIGDRSLFRDEVLRGAVGLTDAGLKAILGLDHTADIGAIREALTKRMGRMSAAGRGVQEDLEAQWWGGSAPPGITADYEYRILPILEEGLIEQLQKTEDAASGLRYVPTQLGIVGLNVLAFRGVSLNKTPGPDTVTTPAYLLSPYTQLLRESLSSQFEIACAGVIGEPLYAKALRTAGFTADEVAKIAQFYVLYDDSKMPEGPSRPRRSKAGRR